MLESVLGLSLCVIAYLGYRLKILKRRLSVEQKAHREDSLEFSQVSQHLEDSTVMAVELAKHAELANDSKSVFLANISHEIRTPLAGVIGLLEMMVECEREDQKLSNLKLCLSSAKTLHDLINDLLDFSKIEAGRLQLKVEPTNLMIALTDWSVPLQMLAKRKGLAFQTNYKNLPKAGVVIDPLRLSQIIRNIVGNAIKFTDKGLVELTVEFKATKDKEGLLCCQIRDTGIGIAPSDQKRLFQRFSQADNHSGQQGTGLGLSISRHLVEAMGGVIQLESAPNQGTTICFQIPVSLSPALGKSDEVSANPSYQKRRILVAEDNRVNQKVITYFLNKANHEVTMVSNGLEVLEKLKQAKYDVLLLDVEMPELDGRQTCKRVLEEFDSLPVIALTAHALKSEETQLLQYGFRAVITKPVQWERLLQIIDQCEDPVAKHPENSIDSDGEEIF